jgi:NAD(P)-dependent dehydrogenase (short-subunit alcohol dehydrogenase family)
MARKSQDPVAVVTGAAAGIGAAIVRQLAASGYRVLGVDRAEPVVPALPATMIQVDLLEPGAIETVSEALNDPAVELLVNCAGIYPATPALDIEPGEWERVLTLDVTVPFRLSQAAARTWVARGSGGTIVQVSSTAAHTLRPGIAHYATAKAGLTQLTRALALEWAQYGIRVNAVAPGLVVTEAGEQTLATDPARAAEHEQKLARIPMGRTADPAEIAGVVGFLASPAAAYMTGQTVYVDGGYTAGFPYSPGPSPAIPAPGTDRAPRAGAAS